MAKLPRGFEEINIANFSSQKQSDRFPNFEEEAFEPADWDSDEEDEIGDDESDDSGPENVLPQTAPWRLNLVALAQKQNLYFTAYQEKLHITVPRGLKQTIPGDPDLIIKLPRSAKARKVGGHIDPSKPHCVNNMIVGNLGNLEMLLMACDDGDVLGYYTHVLDHAVQTRIRTGTGVSIIRPCFHENVGNTVWGLALHEKSRLIAASSNLKEVTVFVPAFTSETQMCLPMASLPTEAFTDTSKFLGTTSTLQANGYLKKCFDKEMSEQSAYFEEYIEERIPKHYNEDQKRQFRDAFRMRRLDSQLEDMFFENRNYSYRKVLKLGIGGRNIPCIAFSNDENGMAVSILAIDIDGSVWTLGIWDRKDDHRIPSMHRINHDRQINPGKMGWGVVILHPSTFRRCGNPQEAFGTTDVKTTCAVGTLGDKVETYFDISSTIHSVTDSSVNHHSVPVSDPLPALLGIPTGLVLDNEEVVHTLEDTFMELDNEYLSRVIAMEQEQQNPCEYSTAATKPTALALTGPTQHGNMYFPASVFPKSDAKYKPDPFKQPKGGRDRETFDYLRCMLDMSASPTLRGKSVKEILAILNSRSREYAMGSYAIDGTDQEPRFALPDKSAILRLYQWGAELIPPTTSRPRTICKEILKQRYGPLATQPFEILNIAQFDRLSINISIPELSLVVLASQSGRVALVTMTCLEDKRYLASEPVFTMRVDRILPTKTQEDEGFRPTSQLLGLAAAPLQERSRHNLFREKVGPKRWRLILHYCDHTILSYEVSRNEKDDLLVL